MDHFISRIHSFHMVHFTHRGRVISRSTAGVREPRSNPSSSSACVECSTHLSFSVINAGGHPVTVCDKEADVEAGQNTIPTGLIIIISASSLDQYLKCFVENVDIINSAAKQCWSVISSIFVCVGGWVVGWGWH